MPRGRACIYCLTHFRTATLIAAPVLPAALGGRLLLERAACSDCAGRVKELTDDYLSRRFAPTSAAMARRSVRGARPGASVEPKSGASEPSRNDWRLAHRAAAIGLFGTIWFRFRFDFEALAPRGRLVALDAVRGARGLAVQRQRGTWRHRSTVRWGWSR